MMPQWNQQLLWMFAFVLFAAPIQGFAASDTSSIGALGTLQPKSGFIDIVGPPGVAIAELSVEVGDKVELGQVLATFDNKYLLEHKLNLLKAELAELEGNLVHDLALQSLAVDKAIVDLNRAKSNLDSYRKLSSKARVTSVMNERKNAVGDANHALKVARSKHAKIEETAELAKEILLIRIEQADRDLSSSQLKLPVNGTVMELHKKVGEAASGPIVTVADLTKMQVVGEVFEGDLDQIKVGQTATAKSKALGQDLVGKVVRIGRRINPDSKVAKIWIDLDKSDAASRYIGMEVNVSIQPRGNE